MAGNKELVDLPNDVLMDILLRLPLKSIGQCKCVCKSWLSVISSSDFLSKHFNNDTNKSRLLFQDCRNCCLGTNTEKIIFPDETLSDLSSRDFDPIPWDDARLVGPCNGVFCLQRHNGDYALWNPAIKQFKHLPAFTFIVAPVLNVSDICGFGLDPSSNNYKIIVIRVISGLFGEEDYLAMVYSLNTNSWRYWEDPFLPNSLRFRLRNNYTYLNGVLYWLVDSIPRERGKVIISFHLDTETFEKIKLPDYPELPNYFSPLPESDIAIFYNDGEPYYTHTALPETLILYKNSLCLFVFENSDKILSIWEMKKDGYWTKQLTVAPLLRVRCPIGWFNDQIIVVSIEGFLLVCDLNTLEIRDFGLELNYADSHVAVLAYKESLVPVNW